MTTLSKTQIEETATGNHEFRILVVIPTLGIRLETLERTIASIFGQTGVVADILIVAKMTSKELEAIAERYCAKITCHEGNLSAAVNFGFAQATNAHRYVSWIGDDDMLRPNSLFFASCALERRPTAVLSYGTCDYINLSGDILFKRRPPRKAAMLLQFVPGLIKQESCLFRLDSLRSAGGLDEQLKYTMDLDLLLKLRGIGDFVKIDQVLAAFCWHPGSITVSNRHASLDEAQMVQYRHSTGLTRISHGFWKYPIRYLILGLSWKINRNLS